MAPEDAGSSWPDGEPVTPWADPWHDFAGDVREVMDSIFAPLLRPLPPGEFERQCQIYSGEGGHLDRETITRVFMGEFD